MKVCLGAFAYVNVDEWRTKMIGFVCNGSANIALKKVY